MPKYLLENQASERLIFRKLTASDFDDWLPFYHNPKSTQFWEGLPTDPVKACREQFNRVFERYENDLGGMNALISKESGESGELVGICGLLVQTVDNVQELEIGYSILPKHWLQGYAIEAAQKCKKHAFDNSFSDSLISIIHVDNVLSQKVAKKNGMCLDKTTTYKDNPVHIFRVNRG
ncbi:GCN5-related N-acetyltransferase [Allomuricauda ruestringensis DSM 13258]|uniref:GCN5-related N-acetyltransferase n=1 Tax=Allomuricauda ruestringensis (strain DSM 13258 / CIP 107369 / LMG 19739 / B1) TaxID=886377 RepID=G2PSS4_ALLRU|nr:GNAT family N-acetyltransferase [Allomuricauda ruestringensis]AEM69551.1 GCN5-related N-acetyltransferase [Allomuricauda ruestringensis DSM 13258]